MNKAYFRDKIPGILCINDVRAAAKSMERINQVLEVLYDADRFVALSELAEPLRLSAPRVAGAIEALRQRGHLIDHMPGAGFRLRRPACLDAHLIERGLGTQRVGRHAIVFGEVDSTNDVAFTCARQKDSDGLVVLADSQRAGRGRHGRRWVSPPGSNILMSVLLLDPSGALPHEAITIAAGLAVADAIERATGLVTQLKWPNDVYLDSAKLCGVLVEVRTVDGRRCVVVGIGINVNAAPPASAVDHPAACLADKLGSPVERVELARAVLRELDARICSLADLQSLHRGWMSRCDMVNHRITVSCEGRLYTGRVLDVNPLEGLVLQCDGGVQVHLQAAGSSIVK